MASTSSNTPQWKHDVFVSFRGADIRSSFLSHLQSALLQAPIGAFFDDQLDRGENITNALLTRIAESKISLVIFSKNYADSSWCLDELVKILECKESLQQTVLPVFYQVEPTHVQELSGSFGDAIAKHQHQREFSQDRVDRWSNALKAVAALSGWDLSNFKSESELIVEIVNEILKKLELLVFSSDDIAGLVGIESRIKEVESLLSIGSGGVCIVGIWGMGGIGKTTIAEAVFYRIYSRFEGRCFIRDVKRFASLGVLINEILSQVLKQENFNVGTLLISPLIKNMLQKKKVLIVLDDVNNSHQQLIDQLVGEDGLFFPGSRIILTSRDKHVLDNGRAKIYKVDELDYDESQLLFSLHAFKNTCPTKDNVLLGRAVNSAKGNPLALRILGCSLYGRSTEVWENELAKIEKTPDNELQTILRISYDVLDQNEKDMFLVIACFLTRERKDRVEMILDGCDVFVERGISRLMDMSLITISKYNEVLMHDLLVQMGKDIVCEEHRKEPGKRRRLWDRDDILRVLTRDTGTETIEAISLNMWRIKDDIDISPTAFTRMYNLRFLEISFGLHLRIKGLQFFPKSLRFLRWDDCPLESLPFNFFPENLVELIMHGSRVKQLWDGVQPTLMNLKILELRHSKDLITIGGDFSKVPNLEVINLIGCTNLVEISSSIRCCSKLTFLYLSDCENLCSFPKSSLHSSSASPSWLHVTSAEFFNFSGCAKITEFPDVPRNVEELCLRRTAIKEVPPSIEHLSDLRELCLAVNDSLESLPSSIGNLKCLEGLDLEGCSKLASLPNSICSLFNLTWLRLSDCKRLQCLPKLPSSLEELVAKNCTSLRSVASLFTEGTGKINVDFSNCFNLDQSSIMDDAQQIFQRGVRELGVCIPGSEVPEWFWHKETAGSCSIKLTPKSHHNNCEILGWAFCAVVGNSASDYSEFEITVDLVGPGHESNCSKWYSADGHLSVSEHVILWNYLKFVPIKEARFYTEDAVIKKCGIHPVIGQGENQGQCLLSSSPVLEEERFSEIRRPCNGMEEEIEGGFLPSLVPKNENDEEEGDGNHEVLEPKSLLVSWTFFLLSLCFPCTGEEPKAEGLSQLVEHLP